MDDEERDELAWMCRCQAAFATSTEVRDALLELAERYRRGEAPGPTDTRPPKRGAADDVPPPPANEVPR